MQYYHQGHGNLRKVLDYNNRLSTTYDKIRKYESNKKCMENSK